MLTLQVLGKCGAENFHPNPEHDTASFATARWVYSVQHHIIKPNDFSAACVMRQEHGTEIVTTDVSEMKQIFGHANGLYCSNRPCDGIMTTAKNVAIMGYAADCWFLAAHDEGNGRIGLFHCGFRSLVPANGSPGILQRMIEGKHFSPKATTFRLIAGIGPCCYGFTEHVPECTPNALVASFPMETATEGPRKGHPSLNMLKLINGQLCTLRVSQEMIKLDQFLLKCPSCTKMADGYFRHSHVRDGGGAGRNLVIAWQT